MFKTLSKRNKIVAGVFLIVFAGSCFYLYQSSRPTKIPNINTPPTPGPLLLVNSYPPKGDIALTFPTTALTYTFNQSVALSQFRVDILPKTETTSTISSDGKTIYVKPKTFWKLNLQYEVSLIGLQGTILETKKITFVAPKNVPEDTERNDKGI